ncbi:probable cation-transporting ATPase 13A3, partial [Anneissia japonica]|uniref:probable cation-transporting ATPase 13A3 n=1 Tax=Anneissia japonica TaxID=1529436 RepID=UPI001425B7CB
CYLPGDNILTAISVARKCNLVTTYQQVFQVHAETPRDNAANIQLTLANDVTKTNCVETKVNMDSLSTDVPLDMCYAVDGKSFAVLREHYPEQFEKVVTATKVFARMSPAQKDQCVEKLQEIGLTVGMCGDGANDCGALKTAHVGISLSEAEASVASPFTSKTPDIACVPAII